MPERDHLKSAAIRFWAGVKKTNGCWLWTKGHCSFGYGRLRFRREAFLAHRLSYILHHGEIPNGLFVLHRCDNPPCVNPDHLFLGTQSDNCADMFAKGRCGSWKSTGKDFAGSKNRNSKLTESVVEKILEDKRPQRIVADAFDISQAQVWNIRRGLQWKHVRRLGAA